MKKTIITSLMLIALISCKSNKKEETTKTEETIQTEQVSTLDAFFSPTGEVVTAALYPTAETSRQLLLNQDLVGVNTFLHKRELSPTDKQTVVRMNRDTYYSFAVVNVSKGATVTIPEIPEDKYVSVMSVTEDHRIQAMRYGPGTYDLTTHTGTHLFVAIRLDATFSKDEAQAIQDKMVIAANSDEKFTTTPINKESFTEVEDALKAKLPALVKRDGPHALHGMFTDARDESNELFTDEKYQVGAAVGWGGAQIVDNIYELSGNYSTDGCYQLTFEDPENIAFWSITVYDKKGFMFNDLANYSSNTAQANDDGTFTISFGCGVDAPNNLEISNPTGEFNLGIRHYQASKRVIEDDYRLVPLMKAVSK